MHGSFTRSIPADTAPLDLGAFPVLIPAPLDRVEDDPAYELIGRAAVALATLLLLWMVIRVAAAHQAGLL